MHLKQKDLVLKMSAFRQIADLFGAIMVEFTHKEKHTNILAFVFLHCMARMEVFTFE